MMSELNVLWFSVALVYFDVICIYRNEMHLSLSHDDYGRHKKT